MQSVLKIKCRNFSFPMKAALSWCLFFPPFVSLSPWNWTGYIKNKEKLLTEGTCMPFSEKVIEHNQSTGFLKADPLQIDTKTISVTMLSARWLRNLALNEDRDFSCNLPVCSTEWGVTQEDYNWLCNFERLCSI